MPKQAQERTVKTTVLIINPAEIDWKRLRDTCCLVAHELPPKKDKDYSYYPRVHNWYKEACDFPCYLHTHSSLYVKYPSPKEISTLTYEDKPLRHAIVDFDDSDIFHAIVKALVSDYFAKYETFVSNVHFFLRVSPANEDYVTGLEIQIKQDPKNRNQFFFVDEATRLRKLSTSEIEETTNWWNKNYYGLFYLDGQAIFKQLKPSQIDKRQKKQGIYVVYRNPQYKASVTYHSLESIEKHRESRTYLLNMFFDKLLQYLAQNGLPFRLKELTMQRVSTKHGEKMTVRQLPPSRKMIYIVNDLMRPKPSSDTFIEEFLNIANSIFSNFGVACSIKEKSALEDGDWVLRLQDYEAKDFQEGGLLKDVRDPKIDFYATHSTAIKQSLSINSNSQIREKEKRLPKEKRSAWTKDRYFDYQVPANQKDLKNLEMKLDVCLNQLILKDAVMYRHDACSRLPQLETMTDKVFLYDNCLAYLDGSMLELRELQGNIEEATKIILEKTGKSLMEDILIPSISSHYIKSELNPKNIANTLNRRFIITKHYVLEIKDSSDRMLYDDLTIRERFETLEEPIPTRCFYPVFPLQGDEPFSEEQLKAYEAFLRNTVKEAFISYNELKKKYGIPLKGKEKEKSQHAEERFYDIFKITTDRKLKKYFDLSLRLKFESLRDPTVIPIYQGIWYEPTTRQYLVGSKYGRQDVQEKGFVFRQIVDHSNRYSDEEFFELLKQEFFPMLEVNFIKYNDYTVYPFPFKLIEIWKDT